MPINTTGVDSIPDTSIIEVLGTTIMAYNTLDIKDATQNPWINFLQTALESYSTTHQVDASTLDQTLSTLLSSDLSSMSFQNIHNNYPDRSSMNIGTLEHLMHHIIVHYLSLSETSKNEAIDYLTVGTLKRVLSTHDAKQIG